MVEQLAQDEAARAVADQARRGLITALSHDLRTPLAALQVLTEAVQDRIVAGATRARYLREMQVHVAALSELIDDLFELSRAHAHAFAPSNEPVELGELVSETVAAMRATAELNGVLLRSEPPAGQALARPLAARADPRQIRRVVLNLLDNAIRHTPPGGEVCVRTTLRGARVQVDVEDDGSGVLPHETEKVFEAFYQGDESNGPRRGNGTGLGLAIARAILDAHGGEIWIDPVERGTSVSFSLPGVAQHRPHPTRGHVNPIAQSG